MCHLIIKGRERTQQLFGYDPAFIHIPLTRVYLQQLPAQSLEFQCAIADYVGGLEINLPSDRLLENIPFLQIRLAEKVSPTPITGARTVFLDGSRKTKWAAIAWQEGKTGEILYPQDIPLTKGPRFLLQSWPVAMAPGTFEYSL